MYENLPAIEFYRRVKNIYGESWSAFNMWESGTENSKVAARILSMNVRIST